MNFDIHLDHFILRFPDDWNNRAEIEMPSKGYLNGASVESDDGRRFPVFFFDPVRLRSELELEITNDRPVVAEPGMIVIPIVTREAIRKALELLVEEGYFAPMSNPAAVVGFG